MILREITPLLKNYAKQFRALAIVGPRQSGKTTLTKLVFPKKKYVTLENPDDRAFATEDPKGFLNSLKMGAIIDEAQRVPVLFNYLQQILDETKKNNLFVLTGSNNFLLQQNISQSLAGRIGYLDLLPLSVKEINEFGTNSFSANNFILNGGYPEIYAQNRNPKLWYQSYIRTYIERDVKQISNIENTILFNKFLQICAGRIGQQINTTALSNECGVEIKTINRWLSILQSSFVLYLLPPYFKNYNKRITKTAKLYFYDLGLASRLLNITTETEISFSHFKGALFENFVINEIVKAKANFNLPYQLYYWRDNKGMEIDVVLDDGKNILPIEIKSSQTFNRVFVHNILKWNELTGNKTGKIIFDGTISLKEYKGIEIHNWYTINFKKIFK